MCLFNAQSVGQAKKRDLIADYIVEKEIGVLVLTETWLRPCGEEPKCMQIIPAGYCMKSFFQTSRSGGIAIVYRETFHPHSTFSIDLPFQHTSFEIEIRQPRLRC